MKKYKTLLFDVDGTLLDFDKTQEFALNYMFNKYNVPLTKETRELYDNINHGLWKQFEDGLIDKKTVVYTRFVKLFKILNIDLDGKAFEDEYQYTLGQGFFVLDHTKEVLENLYTEYDLYIVTNGVSSTQYSRQKGSGIDKYFKGVFVSEDIGYQKPAKEYFDYCFEHIENLKLDETLIIGDSLSSDIQGGINAGIDTCWFNPKHMKQTLDATYVIEDLRELYTILKGE